MSSKPIRRYSPWALTSLVALSLVLVAGCSSKTGKTHYAARAIGSNCFAKAVPTTGEGGLAWGDTLSIARKKSLDNCVRYASRSGGAPSTCQVVMAKCKN